MKPGYRTLDDLRDVENKTRSLRQKYGDLYSEVYPHFYDNCVSVEVLEAFLVASEIDDDHLEVKRERIYQPNMYEVFLEFGIELAPRALDLAATLYRCEYVTIRDMVTAVLSHGTAINGEVKCYLHLLEECLVKSHMAYRSRRDFVDEVIMFLNDVGSKSIDGAHFVDIEYIDVVYVDDAQEGESVATLVSPNGFLIPKPTTRLATEVALLNDKGKLSRHRGIHLHTLPCLTSSSANMSSKPHQFKIIACTSPKVTVVDEYERWFVSVIDKTKSKHRENLDALFALFIAAHCLTLSPQDLKDIGIRFAGEYSNDNPAHVCFRNSLYPHKAPLVVNSADLYLTGEPYSKPMLPDDVLRTALICEDAVVASNIGVSYGLKIKDTTRFETVSRGIRRSINEMRPESYAIHFSKQRLDESKRVELFSRHEAIFSREIAKPREKPKHLETENPIEVIRELFAAAAPQTISDENPELWKAAALHAMALAVFAIFNGFVGEHSSVVTLSADAVSATMAVRATQVILKSRSKSESSEKQEAENMKLPPGSDQQNLVVARAGSIRTALGFYALDWNRLTNLENIAEHHDSIPAEAQSDLRSLTKFLDDTLIDSMPEATLKPTKALRDEVQALLNDATVIVDELEDGIESRAVDHVRIGRETMRDRFPSLRQRDTRESD